MDSWLIGSDPESDIVVNHRAVSGRHCRLSKASGGFLLEDLGSTNGTYVNGERITEVRRVSKADSITLGTKMPLAWPADAEPEPVAAVVEEPAAIEPEPASGGKTKFVIAGVVLSLLLAAGLFAWMNRKQLGPTEDPVPEDPIKVAELDEPSQQPIVEPIVEEPKVGFQMGTFEANDRIESIKVTLFVGDKGADLEEPVDLHLGLGFPLRLYPVGSEERDPAFSAFPQDSSIEPGETLVAAGSNAWFKFLAKQSADQGLDVLRTTPPLLTDVRYADIQRIGFACRGDTAWVLDGYKIEINDNLFASHDSVDRSVLVRQEENRVKLKQLLAEAEPLALEVMQGEAYAKAQLANDTDKADLAAAKEKLDALEDPVNVLRGQTAGIYPWYVEDNEAFKPIKPASQPVRTVVVKLLTGGDQRSGTMNSVYLKAAGHKYLLASAVDPLTSDPELQEFTIPRDALNFDPITSADLTESSIGIGMLGNDDAFDVVPDRANVQRVILEVDDKPTYDSEKNAVDRSTLAAVSLIPPVHRDNVGLTVENPSSPYEVYLWKTGMALPAEPKKEIAPEPSQKKDVEKDADNKKPDVKKPDVKKPDDKKPDDKKKLPGAEKKPSEPKKKKTGPLNSRRRPPFPIIVINFPSPRGSTVPNTPGRRKPVISDVRIEPDANAVRFGSPCRVTWKVLGNKSQVSKFRVRLYPALPHVRGPIIRPVANTTSTSSGSRRVSLTPSLNLLATTGVASAQHPFLYVRPEVTALDSRNRVINGTAATGPILPIFKGTPARLRRASPPLFTPDWLVAAPGATAQPVPAFPFNAGAARFAAVTAPNWPFNRPITPGDPRRGHAVWRIDAPEVSQGTEFDAYPFHFNGRWAHNTAMLPDNNRTVVATQFVAFNVPAPRRIVAHVGFFNDGAGASWNNTGRVDVMVRVVDTAFTRVLRWVNTSVPVNFSKSRNRLTPIDIPVAGPAAPAGRLVVGNGSAPRSAVAPVAIDYLYFAPPTPQPSYGRLNAGTPVAISVTFMMKKQLRRRGSVTGKRQAVGVFGARLVP